MSDQDDDSYESASSDQESSDSESSSQSSCGECYTEEPRHDSGNELNDEFTSELVRQFNMNGVFSREAILGAKRLADRMYEDGHTQLNKRRKDQEAALQSAIQAALCECVDDIKCPLKVEGLLRRCVRTGNLPTGDTMSAIPDNYTFHHKYITTECFADHSFHGLFNCDGHSHYRLNLVVYNNHQSITVSYSTRFGVTFLPDNTVRVDDGMQSIDKRSKFEIKICPFIIKGDYLPDQEVHGLWIVVKAMLKHMEDIDGQFTKYSSLQMWKSAFIIGVYDAVLDKIRQTRSGSCWWGENDLSKELVKIYNRPTDLNAWLNRYMNKLRSLPFLDIAQPFV